VSERSFPEVPAQHAGSRKTSGEGKRHTAEGSKPGSCYAGKREKQIRGGKKEGIKNKTLDWKSFFMISHQERDRSREEKKGSTISYRSQKLSAKKGERAQNTYSLKYRVSGLLVVGVPILETSL